MIFDFDDFHEHNHRLDLLCALKAANPDFRCTLFAVPALSSPDFWRSVPDWLELVPHGWTHGDPQADGGECLAWPSERMEAYVRDVERLIRVGCPFVRGFKAPGWQISDGCYEALARHGWWVADQAYNDERRPAGLRVHRLGDGDHWHGHIQDVCGNGLEETFPELVERVRAATSFELVSEVVTCPTTA